MHNTCTQDGCFCCIALFVCAVFASIQNSAHNAHIHLADIDIYIYTFITYIAIYSPTSGVYCTEHNMRAANWTQNNNKRAPEKKREREPEQTNWIENLFMSPRSWLSGWSPRLKCRCCFLVFTRSVQTVNPRLKIN